MIALPYLSPLLAVTSFLYQTAHAASGCGSPSPWKFSATNHSNITIDTDRSFLVHLPTSYDFNVAHSVVLSYHGFGENDTQQELISQFSDHGLLINERGIIAVYPMGAYGPGKDGTSATRAWQGAPYAKPGVDDIAFTENIITALNANLCIDNQRIYAAGKSNGGGFTNLLACTPSTSTIIAAFAPVSAALYPGTHPFSGCNPARPVPLINFHGLADNVIPFGGQNASSDGNTAYALPNITQYREHWALRDGCSSTTPSSITHPYVNTTEKEWDCSSSDLNAVVKGYSMKGVKHWWPTTAGFDGGKATFNATPEDIVPFFDAHPLP